MYRVYAGCQCLGRAAFFDDVAGMEHAGAVFEAGARLLLSKPPWRPSEALVLALLGRVDGNVSALSADRAALGKSAPPSTDPGGGWTDPTCFTGETPMLCADGTVVHIDAVRPDDGLCVGRGDVNLVVALVHLLRGHRSLGVINAHDRIGAERRHVTTRGSAAPTRRSCPDIRHAPHRAEAAE